MRLSLSALLSLLCASSACFGGPTSDWPHHNQGDDGAPGGTDTPPRQDPSQGSSKPGGSGPAGQDPSVPAVEMDAGSSAATPPFGGLSADAGVKTESMGDGGVGDGGVADGGAGDGGADADVSDAGLLDGAAPSACTIDFDARDGGACFGVYCASTAARLPRTLSQVGACRDDADLTLVCDGALTRVVSACAQDDALMLGLGSSVASCARGEPSLARASDGCLDCYVREMLCAVQSCLTPCLAGLSPLCTACRIDRCGAAFQGCSGLTSP